jgi:hypothetical protein
MALPGAKRLARLEVLKGGLAQSGRAVPVIGSAASYLVEEVLNYNKRRLKRQALLLTEQEQDLLYVLQASARTKRLLLAIDHLEFWDEASWSLLAVMLSGSLNTLYPFLENAVFVFGISRDTPERLRALLDHNTLRELPIRLLEATELPNALLAFEFPPLSPDRVALLFQMTNAQLDLLNDVGRYLRSADLSSPPITWSELYTNLIRRRIDELRGSAKDLEDTLTAAAIVGTAFSVTDVACLTGSARDAVTATLRFACLEHFVTEIGDSARFGSAELHQYFSGVKPTEHSQYHARFAECLRIMRPGDYSSRARHLLLSGQPEEALAYYAMSVIAARRENRPAPNVDGLAEAQSWNDIRRYLDAIVEIMNAYDEGRISDGLEVIDRLETFLPANLIAERDHLKALLLLAAPTIDSYDQARNILEPWRSLANRESELWARIAQTLMVAQVQTGHLEDAQQLEAQLTADFWARRQVDPWVLYSLNVLRRRAECLHSLPTATQRLESAIAYFGPDAGDTMPRHPTQFYYALTNLVGNLIACGRFKEADAQALLLESLIHRFDTLSWPSPEVAANNSLVARHLSGSISASIATELARKLVAGSSESGDYLLLQNNYAVFALRAGDVQTARSILESALASLVSQPHPDGYHRYFISNNLAGLLGLEGNVARAMELVGHCADVLHEFYPAVRGTLTHRQTLLNEAVRQAPNLSLEAFDGFILQRYGAQVGPQWEFYGRGFLLTDIQFWSAV